MNKRVIVTGLGVAALAAMPLLGVYAADKATMQRTDHLTVTIDKGCTFAAEAADGVDNAVILAQGASADNIHGVVFDITCPSAADGSSWELSAAGLNGSNKLSDGGENNINSASGDLSGVASNWAFKLVGTGSAQIQGSYDKYAAVPATSTKVATGDGTEGDSKIEAFYGVYAAAEQAPGTYEGGVTYTLTSTAAE